MIDFHVHVYPPEIIRDAELISKHEPYFNALTHNRVHKWSTVDVLTLGDFRICIQGFRTVPTLQ